MHRIDIVNDDEYCKTMLSAENYLFSKYYCMLYLFHSYGKNVGRMNFGALKSDYALDAFMKFNAAFKDETIFLKIYFSLRNSIHISTNSHLN